MKLHMLIFMSFLFVLACQPQIDLIEKQDKIILEDHFKPQVDPQELLYSKNNTYLTWTMNSPIPTSSKKPTFKIILSQNQSELNQNECNGCITATHVGELDDDEFKFEPPSELSKGLWYWKVRLESGNQVGPWSEHGMLRVE